MIQRLAYTFNIALLLFFIFLIKDFSGLISFSKILLIILIPYYALKLRFGDSIESIIYLISLNIFISFFEKDLQFVLTAIVIFSSIMHIYKNRQDFIHLINRSRNSLNEMPIVDIFAWFLFIGLILFLSNSSSDFYLIHDGIHPLYSLSIGQSAINNPLILENLSYLGADTLRYNFLFDPFAIYLSNVLNTKLFEVIFFEEILYLSVCLFIVLKAFIKTLKLKTEIPVIFIFFLPVFFYSPSGIETFIGRTLFFTAPYFLATILLISSVYLFQTEKFKGFFIAASILANVKFMYFVTLFGGILLYSLKRISIKRSVVIFVLLLISLTTYFVFLSGGNFDAKWYIFPQVVYLLSPKTIFNGGFEFIWPRFISMLVFLIYSFITLRYFLKSQDNSTILLLSSIGLSGILGIVFSTETEFLSSMYFYIAASFSYIILAFAYISEIKNKFYESKVLQVLSLIFFSVWTSLTILFLLDELLDISINKSLLLFAIVLLIYGISYFLIINRKQIYGFLWITILVSLLNIISLRNLSYPFFSSFHKENQSNLLVERNLIDFYQWVRNNLSNESIILSNYEDFSQPFISSALSGKRFYFETQENYFGIKTNKDYEYRKIIIRFLYRLFEGKNYKDICNNNTFREILGNECDSKVIERFVVSFFKENKISHVIFRQDNPSHKLLDGLLTLQFSHGEFNIYRVKDL